MLTQLQVGSQNNQDGMTQQSMRGGREGDLIVSELHGKLYEFNSRGGIFTAFVNSVTLASTHATPIAAGTGTPIIGIYNPVGSKFNLSILKTVHTSISGTPGGPLLWNVIPNPQNISITPTLPMSNNVLTTGNGSIAKLFNNTAITGSTAGVPFRTLGGASTTAVGAGLQTITETHEGDLIIPPGSMLAIAATAVGTSHIISAFVEWEEVTV
jgi:hypothetical protein